MNLTQETYEALNGVVANAIAFAHDRNLDVEKIATTAAKAFFKSLAAFDEVLKNPSLGSSPSPELTLKVRLEASQGK